MKLLYPQHYYRVRGLIRTEKQARIAVMCYAVFVLENFSKSLILKLLLPTFEILNFTETFICRLVSIDAPRDLGGEPIIQI